MLVISSSTVAPFTTAVFKVGRSTRQFQITVIGSGTIALDFEQWSGTYSSSDNAFNPPSGEFVPALSISASGTYVVSGVFDFVRFKCTSGTITRVFYREVDSGEALPEVRGLAPYVSQSAAGDFAGVNTKINEILAALVSAGLMEGS